jgi:peptidoglycan hydrolase-like protein with peptidoglycan-binding domain
MPAQSGVKLAAWRPEWPILMLKTPLMRSDRVRAWQQRMHDRGWHNVPAATPYSRHPNATFDVDGEFGVDTAAIAWAFQREKGLEVDGKVGPQTWATAARSDNVTPT